MHRPLTLSILLTAATLVAPAATAAPSGDVSSCAIDDLYPTCTALVGPQRMRSRNATWRAEHMSEQSMAPDAYTLTFRGVVPGSGSETALSGLTVVDVLPAGCHGERVAIVRLEAPLAETCGANEIALRLDDHIGRNTRVVAVRPEGLLTMVGGTLHFVRADDFQSAAPSLKLSYASSFEIMSPAPTHVAASPKRTPRTARKRRQRS